MRKFIKVVLVEIFIKQVWVDIINFERIHFS